MRWNILLMKLKVNLIGYLLAGWDDFRTFRWVDLIDESEKMMDDVQASLATINP